MVDEIDIPDGKIKALSDLDPRMPEEEVRTDPGEDLVLYQLDPRYPEREVMLGSQLRVDIRAELEQFLREYRDVFA